MENQKLPMMTLSLMKKALSRKEMKKIMEGSNGQCLSRWMGCSSVTEETNCCGSGRCMVYNGWEQCV